jgi:hypothetical protein
MFVEDLCEGTVECGARLVDAILATTAMGVDILNFV